MTITITAEERDALYEHIYVRLSGIGDVWLAVQAEDFEMADRLGREFADDLYLVLDDLGWGETGDHVVLRTPPKVLRRVFDRVQQTAEAERACVEQERLEVQAQKLERERIIKTCRRVLSQLGA